MKADVGFVGLGTMGRSMARRLLEAGHRVTVWNRSPAPVEELARQGAVPAGSLREVFARPVVFSMLADDDSVRRQVAETGVLTDAACGVHINMATVSTAFARELAARHREHGIGYVAAPVLGRADVAAVGALHILAAGDAQRLAELEPLLRTMGRRIWNLGTEPERANAVKIAVNFMVANAIESISEACALVESFGVERTLFAEVMTGTVLPGPVYTAYGGLVANRTYEPPGFTARLGLKDVRLAQAAAAANNVPLPLAGLVHDALLQALAKGWGEQDWAVLSEVARDRAGLPR
ncbi:NAD(P)-dependent oxidoreductase [Streptomyces sp. NBC_01089]|uniref:NAD(P)-dependent oxidoreductase n=1 Tax=Streptomyces sp. NBC_01089 TaxID=2903747 RepID=UPI00386F471A|nr:NAD(P)-dependent oxidoreductase [Streptomyces sp. NBC_01089]